MFYFDFQSIKYYSMLIYKQSTDVKLNTHIKIKFKLVGNLLLITTYFLIFNYIKI